MNDVMWVIPGWIEQREGERNLKHKVVVHLMTVHVVLLRAILIGVDVAVPWWVTTSVPLLPGTPA